MIAPYPADDRITTSVSANALSLITNDLARPYQPRRTERLFIPYYGMLAYARLEQWEDAAVEARRLSALLAQYGVDRTDTERATHATLHYLAGVVFERAGADGMSCSERAYPTDAGPEKRSGTALSGLLPGLWLPGFGGLSGRHRNRRAR